jgi:hypothetical protein
MGRRYDDGSIEESGGSVPRVRGARARSSARSSERERLGVRETRARSGARMTTPSTWSRSATLKRRIANDGCNVDDDVERQIDVGLIAIRPIVEDVFWAIHLMFRGEQPLSRHRHIRHPGGTTGEEA